MFWPPFQKYNGTSCPLQRDSKCIGSLLGCMVAFGRVGRQHSGVEIVVAYLHIYWTPKGGEIMI